MESMWNIELDLGDGDGFVTCDEYLTVSTFENTERTINPSPRLMDKLHRQFLGHCTNPTRQELLENSVEETLKKILRINKTSQLLIMSDDANSHIGNAFIRGATNLGVKVQEHIVPNKERRNAKSITELMRVISPFFWADTIINVSSSRGSINPASLLEKGTRYYTCPGINEEMIIWGAMTVNYDAMLSRHDGLIEAFHNSVSAHVTTARGTNLWLDTIERQAVGDADAKPGQHANLPAGEVFLAPVEGSANGQVVADVSIYGIGLLKSPITFHIENGRLTALETKSSRISQILFKTLNSDEGADVVSELGIGINDAAVITGNILEDEKKYGTAHIAFGNNLSFPGGQNNSKVHVDVVFDRPTINIEYEDGSRMQIMKGGKLISE